MRPLGYRNGLKNSQGGSAQCKYWHVIYKIRSAQTAIKCALLSVKTTHQHPLVITKAQKGNYRVSALSFPTLFFKVFSTKGPSAVDAEPGLHQADHQPFTCGSPETLAHVRRGCVHYHDLLPDNTNNYNSPTKSLKVYKKLQKRRKNLRV